MASAEPGVHRSTSGKPGAALTRRSRSPSAQALARLRREPGFIAGGALILVLVLAAILAPWLRPYDPIEMRVTEALRPPSLAHLMGTDNFGRDIWSRVLSGAALSMGVGLVATLLAACVGTALGLVAGYVGGWVDTVISWVVDVLMAFPGILLALGVIAVLGPGLFNVLLAVGVSSIPGFIRLARGPTLVAKETLYVEAARCVGARPSRIIFRHILPNVLSSVLVWASLGLAGMILSASGLSFLGLGAQPPSPEWGVMVSAGRGFLRQAWWMSVFPGAAIVVTVLAINLIGDALRDALDPRLRMR
jgi:peptide/nickel transport system permease protein